jgi:hypothetical protein
MTTQDPGHPPDQPTEEELQAAYEAELKRIHVDDVLLQTVVSLLNLGGRRAGLSSPHAPGPVPDDERDLDQVRSAIEGVRALLPLVEPRLGPDAGQLRQALSQLQLAYARGAGGEPGGAPPEGGGAPTEPKPAVGQEGPGPAQSSGRLWVPGQ